MACQNPSAVFCRKDHRGTGRKPRVPVLGSLTWIMDLIHHRCMVVRKSIKHRVCPPLQQEAYSRASPGTCGPVFNLAPEQREMFTRHGHSLPYEGHRAELCPETTASYYRLPVITNEKSAF